MKKYKLIDLFSGVGGISQGFHWAGFETILANEYDESIGKAYKANFPDTKMIIDDIRNIDFEKLMLENNIKEGEIDVIAGGPPCQGFSMANRKKIEEDQRNLLFLEFVRAVKTLKPKCFLIENVMGMTVGKIAIQNNSTNVISSMTEYFEELGYQISFKSFKSEEFGVPQMRRRVIVIGTNQIDKFIGLKSLEIGNLSKEFKSKEDLNQKKSNQADLFSNGIKQELRMPVTVWDALSDLPQMEDGCGEKEMDYALKPQNDFQKKMREKSTKVYNHISTPHSKEVIERMQLVSQGQNHQDLPEEMRTKSVHSGAYGRLSADFISPTITTRFDTPSTGRVIHPYSNRTLTVREAARIQSFPDHFEFIGTRTSQGKQVGNAVPPIVAEKIAEMFIKDFLS